MNNLLPIVSFPRPELRRCVVRPMKQSELKSWKQTHTVKQREQICLAPGVSCSLLSVLFPLTYCSTLSHSHHAVPFKGNSMKLHFCIQEASGYPAPATEKTVVVQLLFPLGTRITTGTDFLEEAHQHHEICSPFFFPFQPCYSLKQL